VGHHADGSLARGQFDGEARLVGITQSEVLVVKGSGRRAADHTDAQDRRAKEEQDTPDRGAFARASRANLVLLELPWESRARISIASPSAIPDSFKAAAALSAASSSGNTAITSCRSAIGGTSSRTRGHLWCWTHDSGILIDAHQPLGVTLDPGDDGGRGRATWFA
jgi:hypothetical protein